MPFPDMSPVAFSLFGFAVRWYALAYVAGFMASFYFVKSRLRSSVGMRVSYVMLDDLLGWLVLGIVAGGRLGYVLFYNFAHYARNPVEVFMVWTGGMSFHGGLLGAAATLWLWCRVKGQPFWRLSDLCLLPAPIGLFLGRVANFVNGELYGRPTDSPLGMVFPNSDGLPRHPSQLYEAALEGVAMFALLNLITRLRSVRGKPGVVSAAFLGLYGAARVAVEFFREPDVQIGYLPLGVTMGQALTVPAILFSAFLLWRFLRRRPETETFAASPLLGGVPFVRHGFFTRQGGVSVGPFASANCRFETSDPMANVRENRRRLLASLGIDAKKSLVTLHQQHTSNVVVITSSSRAPEEYLAIEADAVVTDRPGLAVGILTADCVPVLMVDPSAKIVAAVHCGWKGIRRGIIEETLKALASLGSKTEDLRVALGPCLKQASYEVDADFKKGIGRPGLFRRRGGKYLFDCAGYALERLRRAGVGNIDVMDFDTYGNEDL
ncbi:MAG: prolipoprotein diacylglyceryl transferase, partial [Rickettsiales bacterium]|nr:prolipoprotein diacylglyceryl transferase [Rickettsiales bacterium]